MLNAALEGVVNDGTGSAAGIGRPLAGKTGTTENHADAWFIGYVPQLSTAVWVGYPDSLVPMTDVHGIAVAGGTYPARIFARYMRTALAGVTAQDLFTASPDQLSLHRLDVQPTLPPSSSPTPPTTVPPPTTMPPAVIEGQPPETSPSPADGQSNQPSPYQPPPPTTTTTRPPPPPTTQPKEKHSSSQTTLG